MYLDGLNSRIVSEHKYQQESNDFIRTNYNFREECFVSDGHFSSALFVGFRSLRSHQWNSDQMTAVQLKQAGFQRCICANITAGNLSSFPATNGVRLTGLYPFCSAVRAACFSLFRPTLLEVGSSARPRLLSNVECRLKTQKESSLWTY